MDKKEYERWIEIHRLVWKMIRDIYCREMKEGINVFELKCTTINYLYHDSIITTEEFDKLYKNNCCSACYIASNFSITSRCDYCPIDFSYNFDDDCMSGKAHFKSIVDKIVYSYNDGIVLQEMDAISNSKFKPYGYWNDK